MSESEGECDVLNSMNKGKPGLLWAARQGQSCQPGTALLENAGRYIHAKCVIIENRYSCL